MSSRASLASTDGTRHSAMRTTRLGTTLTGKNHGCCSMLSVDPMHNLLSIMQLWPHMHKAVASCKILFCMTLSCLSPSHSNNNSSSSSSNNNNNFCLTQNSFQVGRRLDRTQKTAGPGPEPTVLRPRGGQG